MKRKLGVVLGCMAMVASLVGCSTSQSTTATSAAKETQKITVGYMPNYQSLAILVAGIKAGGFEEQGMEVELVEFADGPTIIAAMESGSLDFGYIGPGAHKLAINGRADIICMAQVGNSDSVISNKEKGVLTGADLKGKTVAYASGTSSEQILKYVLADAGLTMDDINAMEMDASAITTAMISGSVDACATWSPSTITIKEALGENSVVLGSNNDFLDKDVAVASFIAIPTYVEKNRDTVVSFVKGLYAGMDYSSNAENIEQNCKWTAEITGLAFESVYEQREDGDWMDSARLLGLIESGDLEAMYQVQQDGCIASGDVTEPVAIADYVCIDIMEEAGK